MSKNWFVVHVFWFEKSVARSLKKGLIFRVLGNASRGLGSHRGIVEMRGGQKGAGAEIFPGYVLVEMG